MKEKIKINPKRLEWSLSNFNMDLPTLSEKLKVSQKSFEKGITMKQLEKLSDFFGRSLLFFIDPSEIREENIYSPQFRTINNQKTKISPNVKKLIGRVEKQREIFIGLLEDLEEPINAEWHKYKKTKTNFNTGFESVVRKWLNVHQYHDFDSIRQNIESKGIMVILTNGYAGKWQISKEDTVTGFSLYYEKLPIIVVKKEDSKKRQSFTLLHELGHLLIHQQSGIDEDNDFSSHQDSEKEANDFAAKILIPNEILNKIKIKDLEVSEYDDYLRPLERECGASHRAIMLRLLLSNKISQSQYNHYIRFQNDKKVLSKKGGGQRYRHKEPINIFGVRYTKTVFDAFYNNHITLFKASTYLDNLKINDLNKIRHELL